MTLHLPFEVATRKSYCVRVDSSKFRIIFEGAPWDEDFYDWLGGANRTDALARAWTFCKLQTAKRLSKDTAKAYDGSLEAELGLPTGIRIEVLQESYDLNK